MNWIFKAIYYPIFVIVIMVCTAILGMILKDVGWEAPFRWLCIIGMVAYVADLYVAGAK